MQFLNTSSFKMFSYCGTKYAFYLFVPFQIVLVVWLDNVRTSFSDLINYLIEISVHKTALSFSRFGNRHKYTSKSVFVFNKVTQNINKGTVQFSLFYWIFSFFVLWKLWSFSVKLQRNFVWQTNLCICSLNYVLYLWTWIVLKQI